MSGWGVRAGWPAEPSTKGPSPPEFPGRRSFIAALLAVGTAAVGALLSVPLARFVLFPILRRTTNTPWSEAGQIAQFASLSKPAEPVIIVKQLDGWREVISRKPVYVLPLSDHVRHRVLSPVCPHLGCLVPWKESQKEFICPCHGSVFGPDGSLVKGPAPRGLDYLDSNVKDGQLLVRYQYFRQGVPYREVIG